MKTKKFALLVRGRGWVEIDMQDDTSRTNPKVLMRIYRDDYRAVNGTLRGKEIEFTYNEGLIETLKNELDEWRKNTLIAQEMKEKNRLIGKKFYCECDNPPHLDFHKADGIYITRSYYDCRECHGIRDV